jgi:hypothetical protein
MSSFGAALGLDCLVEVVNARVSRLTLAGGMVGGDRLFVDEGRGWQIRSVQIAAEC